MERRGELIECFVVVVAFQLRGCSYLRAGKRTKMSGQLISSWLLLSPRILFSRCALEQVALADASLWNLWNTGGQIARGNTVAAASGQTNERQVVAHLPILVPDSLCLLVLPFWGPGKQRTDFWLLASTCSLA